MRRSVLLVAVAVLVASVSPASADPGGPFRRTTPRGVLDQDARGLIIGIPAGRAWGVEGLLHPLDPMAGPAELTVELAVDDPDVAEAFVRVAYYAVSDRRSRQLATVDSPFVRVGLDRQLRILLQPPPGAVAFRVRVLGRLVTGASISRSDAIRARLIGPAEQGPRRPSLTRLLADLP
ncbi:MAG: hypothetical protein ABI888_07195 [Chloroflexota bacterium]